MLRLAKALRSLMFMTDKPRSEGRITKLCQTCRRESVMLRQQTNKQRQCQSRHHLKHKQRMSMMPMVESFLLKKTLTIRKCFCSFRVLTHFLFIFNRLIIAFKVEELKEGDEFKASWKEVEKSVREKLPKLKIIYARGDDKAGHLALSNLRLKPEMVDQLLAEGVTISEKKFTFEKIEGETLKEFWSEQGGHYNFCI